MNETKTTEAEDPSEVEELRQQLAQSEHDRRHIEEALNERLRFETLISDLSAGFMNVPAIEVDEQIERGLEMLGKAVGVEGIGLLQFNENKTRFCITHHWDYENIHPDHIRTYTDNDHYPWLTGKMLCQESVVIARLDEFPDEATIEKEHCVKFRIQSLLFLPLVVDKSVIGAIGFDAIATARTWSDEVIQRLRLLGEIFANTLIRKRNQEEIQQRLHFEHLISELSATFAHVPTDDVDQKITAALQRLAEFFDLDRAGLLQRREDSSEFWSTHLWSSVDSSIDPLPLNTRIDLYYPWVVEKMLQQEVIALSRFQEECPIDAVHLREYGLNVGLRSILFLPTVNDGTVVGFMGLDTIHAEITWSDEIIQRLTLIGEIFANALAHKRADQQLHKTLAEITQLKDQLQQENLDLREKIELKAQHDTIIGQSPAIVQVLSQIEEVAETDSTVLIQGETGTGKELVAHAIHQLSLRKDRPLVKVNCAALPSSLIENELFGREKGAYTGASSRQVGRFELADGATIFLDEISELPLELQAKLLRVVQESQFERLGSSTTLTVDVRIITATNRDLTRAVQERRFREDLYYRLNVFPITVPPLRERREDIPSLVWAFVREFETTMGKTIQHISRKSLAALQDYPWPGNIRELRNVIEHAMISSKDSTLYLNLPDISETKPFRGKRLEDIERQHILAVLQETGWRIKGRNGAAQILDLKPSTLHSRMKKLGIQRPEG